MSNSDRQRSQNTATVLRHYHPATYNELTTTGRLHEVKHLPVATTYAEAWAGIIHGHDDRAIIPKDSVPFPEESEAELTKGRRFSLDELWPLHQPVYRDGRREDCLKVEEYSTYYLATVENFNPDRGRLIEHVLTDKRTQLFSALAVAGAAYYAARTQ